MPFLRLFVIILLIANVALFLLGRGGLGSAADGEPGRLEKQVVPEKLRLLSEKPPIAQAPVAPTPDLSTTASKPEANTDKGPAKVEEKPAASPSPKTLICKTVPNLSNELASKAKSILKSTPASLKASFKELALPEGSTTYWVNIPPLPDKAKADSKAAELKDKGIKDIFVVQEEGASRYAISLGLYRQEKGAKDYLAYLKQAGVTQARITVRAPETKRDLSLRGPAEVVDGAIAKLNSSLGELRVLNCK